MWYPFLRLWRPATDAFLDLWWDEIPPIGEQQVLDATTLNLVTGLLGGGVAMRAGAKGAGAVDSAGTVTLPAESFYKYSGR